MNYQYKTHDYFNGEQHHYFDFEELRAYLNLYCQRLNEDNLIENESYRYKCETEEDAVEICDVCNIELTIF